MVLSPAVWAAVYKKLCPALVTVLDAWMLITDVPVVNARRKFALTTPVHEPPLRPVCVSVDAVTTTVMVPVVVPTLTLAVPAVNLLAPLTVTVAVGTPLKRTLLPAVASMVVAVLNPIVTTAAPPAPNIKLLVPDVIWEPMTVTMFVPEVGPFMDSAKPADVMVDVVVTVRLVAEAAPA